MLNRGYKFRLYATDEQEALFGQYAGVCRLVYNLGLEQRRDWWRVFKAITGHSISYASQCRELTLLRAEFDWIAAVSGLDRPAATGASRSRQGIQQLFRGPGRLPDASEAWAQRRLPLQRSRLSVAQAERQMGGRDAAEDR